MKFFLKIKKAMDDQEAFKTRFKKVGHKDICENCKFFAGGPDDYWAECHSPLFNRSVQVTTPEGRKTLENIGGSFVRAGFSCPFFKRRGDSTIGGDNPPWGYGMP